MKTSHFKIYNDIKNKTLDIKAQKIGFPINDSVLRRSLWQPEELFWQEIILDRLFAIMQGSHCNPSLQDIVFLMILQLQQTI